MNYLKSPALEIETFVIEELEEGDDAVLDVYNEAQNHFKAAENEFNTFGYKLEQQIEKKNTKVHFCWR